jgi:predicted metal-dependent phosphoesterase TrpH
MGLFCNFFVTPTPRTELEDLVGGWATACETAFWSTGTFARCYETNRRASIDDVVDADPVAACVQEIMATRSAWTGSATDLLRAGADLTDDGIWRGNAGWPQNPRALAGRLRRAQTFLRAVGIDIAFQS